MDRSVCCNWCTAATARGPAQTAGTRAGTTPRTDDGELARDDPGRARARGMRRVARANRADRSRVVAPARGGRRAGFWIRGTALRRAPLRGRRCVHAGLRVVRPSRVCHWCGGRRPDPAGAVGRDRARCWRLHALVDFHTGARDARSRPLRASVQRRRPGRRRRAIVGIASGVPWLRRPLWDVRNG